jgi:serine/threonine protein kinase
MQWEVGGVLAHRYELAELLGGGGLGRVFRARDLRTGRDVAVKLFDPARCPAEALARHAALVRAAMRVKHGAVALPRDGVATTSTPPFVVGEHLAGDDLDSLRARHGALPWERAFEIAARCAEALKILSSETGKAHRALKPGNLRVGAKGEVHLLDFGVAELGVQPVPARGDGQLVEYRAPEQLEGAGGDPRTDVYGLGVLLFEMITGVHPFAGASPFKLRHRVLLQPAPRPADVAPDVAVPARVEDLLARALARRPEERFTDPAEMAKLLAMVRMAPGFPRAASAAGTAAATSEETTSVPAAPERDATTRLFSPRAIASDDPPNDEPTSAPIDAESTVQLQAPKQPPAGPERTEQFAPSAATSARLADSDESTAVLPPVLPAARPRLASPEVGDESTAVLPTPSLARTARPSSAEGRDESTAVLPPPARRPEPPAADDHESTPARPAAIVDTRPHDSPPPPNAPQTSLALPLLLLAAVVGVLVWLLVGA